MIEKGQPKKLNEDVFELGPDTITLERSIHVISPEDRDIISVEHGVKGAEGYTSIEREPSDHSELSSFNSVVKLLRDLTSKK